MNTIQLDTLTAFNIQIWAGLKETNTFKIHTIDEVEEVCQKYCDDIGFCVTVTPTKFIYTKGGEPGVVVGLITYPRFPPKSGVSLKHQAIDLASLLMDTLGQMRVTVTTPKESIMLTNPKITRE